MIEDKQSKQQEDQEETGSDLDSNANDMMKESFETSADPKNPKKRSSRGCITCKIRKKRCDEVKPICGDCKRLNRRCAYITKEMSSDEIKVLKEEMKQIEKNSKARNRKKKVRTEDVVDTNSRKKMKYSAKIVFNPLAMSMASMTNVPVFQEFQTSVIANQLNPEKKVSSKPDVKKLIPINENSELVGSNQTDKIASGSTHLEANFENNTGIKKLEGNGVSSQNVDKVINNDQNFQSYGMKVSGNQTPFVPALSPSFDISTFISSMSQDGNPQPINEDNAPNVSSVPPLSLNGEENPTSFIDLFSNGFSKLLQDHFKTEIPSIPHKVQNESGGMSQIQEAFKFSPRFQPSPLGEQLSQITSITGDNNDSNSDFKISYQSPYNGNVLDAALNLGFPYDGTTSTSNGNYANNTNQGNDDNNKEQSQNKVIDKIKSSTQPQIYTNPSIVLNTTLAGLTPVGKKLYEYYRDKLSFIVCSAPKVENMYLNTFLPMAHIDKSVLYGILAWSAFHLGGPKMEKQGNYYIKLALERFSERPILNEEIKGNLKLICDDVNDEDDEIVKEDQGDDDAEVYEDLELSRLNKDNMINMRLAAFLILCGVEICKGDVSKWSKYLTYGAKLIKLKGGLERFNESKDEHFLVTNYAYHDITAIQVINERTIHFDLNEYEKMWSKSNELGFADPLHGISSPVFKILAEINKLVIVVQKLVKRSMKDETKTTENRDSNKNDEFKGVSERRAHDSQNMSKNVAESPEEKVHGLNEEDYWIGNDFEGSSVASSADGIFMNGIPSTVSDEWVDENFDKEVMLEDLDQVMIECQNIEQRIAAVRPKIALCVSNKDLELQLTMFECFQVTAKIHLRQSVLRMNSASIEIQYLTTQLVKLLDVLLGSDVEACLCFPMFIAGMNCVWKKDRDGMTRRFKEFIKRYKWKNVLRCQIVIRYIWELNHKGEKFVDWYAVVKTLGWDLSFA